MYEEHINGNIFNLPAVHEEESSSFALEEDGPGIEWFRNHDAGVVIGDGGGGGGGQHRRLWVKDRSKTWWEQCNGPNFPNEEFRRAFRMSKSTFDMICDELDAAVTKDPMVHLEIPVRQRVAVCIWRLATGEPLRRVLKRFGLGLSTCHKLVLEVCA